jgi:ABC-2 type transport system permease protein
MGPAGLIAAKDLRLRVRDRSAFILGVVAPLGLAFIFNAILGNVNEGAFVPVFAVTNQDNGAVSSAFVGVLDQLDTEGFIEVAQRPTSVEAARELAEQNDVAASIVIPSGFSDDVVAGRGATVTIIASPEGPTSVEIARAITEGFASEVRTSQLAVATAIVAAGGSPSPELVAGLSDRVAAGLPEAITVGAVETEVRQLDLATFFAASMSVFFLFFTVSFGVNGLLEETQQGTIRRLLAAPIRMLSIVVGKAIVSFVLGIVSMTLLVVASSILIGAAWGNPVGVALLIVMGVASATGIMMVVAAFAKTPEQAGNLMAIIAVGLGMIGGVFFPSDLGSGVLTYLSYLSPHRWFLLGLSDLAGGGDLSMIVSSMAGLAVFTVVTWVVAMARFSRKGLAA